jgi:hypothetical protein
MSKPYIEIIDEKITEHERAIAKLVIAREVVAAIGEEALGGAKPTGKGAAKAATTKRKKFIKGKTRDTILASMQELGRPAMPKDIVAVATIKDPGLTEKAIWNALYNARNVGAVTRDAEGRYALPVTTAPPLGSRGIDGREGEP